MRHTQVWDLAFPRKSKLLSVLHMSFWWLSSYISNGWEYFSLLSLFLLETWDVTLETPLMKLESDKVKPEPLRLHKGFNTCPFPLQGFYGEILQNCRGITSWEKAPPVANCARIFAQLLEKASPGFSGDGKGFFFMFSCPWDFLFLSIWPEKNLILNCKHPLLRKNMKRRGEPCCSGGSIEKHHWHLHTVLTGAVTE